MKKILFLLLLISGIAKGQTPSGFTKISSRYNYLALASDSGMLLPRYAGPPSGLRGGMPNWAGQIVSDTVNGRIYHRFSSGWVRLANYTDIASVGWSLTGNAGTVAGTNFLGTTDGVALQFRTAGALRLSLPATALQPGSASDSILVKDGSGVIKTRAQSAVIGVTPTWQQTLTAGSVLTGNNTVNTGVNNLSFVSNDGTNIMRYIQGGNTTVLSGRTIAATDSILINLRPEETAISLHALSNTNSAESEVEVAYDQVGINTSSVDALTSSNLVVTKDYITTHSGVSPAKESFFTVADDSISVKPHLGQLNIDSLRSGAATDSLLTWNQSTGAVGKRPPSTVATAVPISGLTAGIASNDINSGANAQTWRWNSKNTYGLQLMSNTTADVNTQALFNVELIGANATNGITTYAANISNGHSGTSSTNIALNVSSSGGTTNNALNIAAGAIALNGSAGTSGQVLTSAGANTLPTWSTPSGSGDVTKVGTPANNQVGVWTGDGTIEGDANYTWDASTLDINGALDISTTAVFGGKATFNGGATRAIEITNGGGYELYFTGSGSNNVYSTVTGSDIFYFNTAGGTIAFGNSDGSTAVRVKSDKLGIGVDPTTTLQVAGNFAVQQGADVASANNLAVIANLTEITGTTQINLIANTGWVNGSEITLMFTSTPTVKNGQTTSGSNIKIMLAGAADFVASADDLLTLVLGEIGGVQVWREKSRSVN